MDYATQFIGKVVKVKIDRQMGTKHPKYNYFYPINYGFIEGVKAPDNEDVDVYILGVFQPLEEFEGKCIAVIHRSNDADDKLVVASKEKDYTDEEIKVLTEFQERFFSSTIIR